MKTVAYFLGGQILESILPGWSTASQSLVLLILPKFLLGLTQTPVSHSCLFSLLQFSASPSAPHHSSPPRLEPTLRPGSGVLFLMPLPLRLSHSIFHHAVLFLQGSEEANMKVTLAFSKASFSMYLWFQVLEPECLEIEPTVDTF